MKNFKSFIKEDIFKKNWPDVLPSDIETINKKNNIKTKKDKKNQDLEYGYLKNKHVYTYDNEDYVLYSDFSPLDFKLKRVN